MEVGSRGASKEIMKLRARKVLALLTRGPRRTARRCDEGKYSASISVRGCLSILDEYKVLRFRPTPSPTRRNKFAIARVKRGERVAERDRGRAAWGEWGGTKAEEMEEATRKTATMEFFKFIVAFCFAVSVLAVILLLQVKVGWFYFLVRNCSLVGLFLFYP